MTPNKNIFSRCPIMGNHGKPGSTLTPQKKVTSRMGTIPKMSSTNCCSSGGIYQNIQQIFTTTQLYHMYRYSLSLFLKGRGVLTVPWLRPESMYARPWAQGLLSLSSLTSMPHGRKATLALLSFVSCPWAQIPRIK